MKAADTSLVVAGFASWHEKHDAARRALDGDIHLVEHCALEAYSVLTRLPAPHRAPAVVVRDYLASRFTHPLLRLSPAAYREFVRGLPERDISGGAVYDALIAACASHASADLVSLDRRALSVYEKYGVRVELL